MDQTGNYNNGAPRYGTLSWCRKVVANENLTKADYMRFALDLRRTGNLAGLLHMQRLLREKHETVTAPTIQTSHI